MSAYIDSEARAKALVREHGYSGALLYVGDQMWRARNPDSQASWKDVGDWLLANPHVAALCGSLL